MAGVHHAVHLGVQRKVCRGWFSPSVKWNQGFQFRWLSLATNNFTCQTILLILELFFLECMLRVHAYMHAPMCIYGCTYM